MRQQLAFNDLVQNAAEYNQWLWKNEKPLTDEDLRKHEEELIRLFGKKGVNFFLCKAQSAKLCQNPQNPKVCQATETTCVFRWKVTNGLIIMEEQ